MKKFLLSVATLAMFAAPSFAQEEQDVDVYFYNETEDNQPDYDSQALKPIECSITQDAPNTFTLHNAFGSDNSITFSYNPEEIDDAGWAPLTFYADPDASYQAGSDVYYDGTDLRMWNPDRSRWTVKDSDGSDVEIVDICFRRESPTPCIRVDDGWYEVQIYYWAEASTGWLGSHFMIFTFDEFEDAAVANVEVDENAPAVYYNLQGQKVANPSNGVYIVRQGKSVKKVMVK